MSRRQEVEQQVLEILDFLEVILGPFPYERLGATEVVVPMGLGFDAFSAPMRFVSPRLWSAGRDILVLELSHLWAGNAAIPDPVEGATWMIEGLATYLEMLAAEEMDQDVDVEVIGQRLRDRVGTDTTGRSMSST